MVQAVAHGDDRKDNESRNLNNIDRRVHGRYAGHTTVTNVPNAARKQWTKNNHEYRARHGCVESAGPNLSQHVTDNKSRHANHQSMVNPVVEVAGPTDHEFRNACKPESLCLTEKRLLSEEIGGTCSWIEL